MNFKAGYWNTEINVRGFIQRNDTPCDGDASFLAPPIQRPRQHNAKLVDTPQPQQRFNNV